MQVEDVGNAVGENGERVSSREMRVRDGYIADHRMRVVGLGGTDEDAGLGPGHRGGWNAGIFQRIPRELQQDPLLRIHLLRLARRNAEYARIEAPDIVQNSRGESVTLTRLP